MKHIKANNGDIREDGRRFDGTSWRKVGINHHLNEDGLVYYKRKFRSLDGYLRQGGNVSRLVFGKVKHPKAITKLANLLYNKEQSGEVYVITNPSFEGWVKVGMAVDAKDRVKNYQTGSPFRDYNLYYSKWFKDRRSAEKKVLKKLSNISDSKNGEWFKLDPLVAKLNIDLL